MFDGLVAGVVVFDGLIARGHTGWTLISSTISGN